MLNSKFDRREANRAKFSQNISARRANRSDSSAIRRDAKKAEREALNSISQTWQKLGQDFDFLFAH